MSLSTRNFYFISGNPHYGNLSNVRKGVIEFYEDIRLDRALTCGLDQISTISTEASTPLAPFSMSSSSQILQCIISVPAFMIHEVCKARESSFLDSLTSHPPFPIGNIKISFLNYSFCEININSSSLLRSRSIFCHLINGFSRLQSSSCSRLP
jgi:hypothetical protein